MKRSIASISSTLAVGIFAPAFLIFAIMVKLGSKRPAYYGPDQSRSGQEIQAANNFHSNML
jgi:lipopolysaccharide/colanic/teichoic acid biosynthesis glycosyltransferase